MDLQSNLFHSRKEKKKGGRYAVASLIVHGLLITGVVWAGATDGIVEQVRVLKGLPMGLSEKAEEAVKGWKFKPGTLGGQPVEVIFSLTVNFKLDQ